MALANISKFNWDKFLSKIENTDVKRRVNILRGKANEITVASGKYLKKPDAIDFEGYKAKLKFTAAAVDSLQAAYANKTLPSYHASVPQFETKKREAMSTVAKTIVELAKQDLKDLNSQIAEFEKLRISKETSVSELNDRFPAIAKEIEVEIKNHEWAK